jgi:hypothetical protein
MMWYVCLVFCEFFFQFFSKIKKIAHQLKEIFSENHLKDVPKLIAFYKDDPELYPNVKKKRCFSNLSFFLKKSLSKFGIF